MEYNNTELTIKAIRDKFNIYFEIPCSSDDKRVQEIISKVIAVIREQPSITPTNIGKVELKPCPFCGNKASLKHNGLREDKSKTSVNSFLITYWSVKCDYCGTSKGDYPTEYVFNRNGELSIIEGRDGRQRAIDAWNRRAGDEDANQT